MYWLPTCSKWYPFSAGIYWNMNHPLRGEGDQREGKVLLECAKSWAPLPRLRSIDDNIYFLGDPEPWPLPSISDS